jgi:hypothetical protein
LTWRLGPVNEEAGEAYAGAVPGVIDGRRWLRQRIARLEDLLGGDPPAEQRAQLETELAEAKAELHRMAGWRRWLLWGARR